MADIDIISEGREASDIRGAIGPFITSRIDDLVHLMVAEYRSGGSILESLLGRAAEISSLMHILESLESRMRQGDLAMEREHARSEERGRQR